MSAEALTAPPRCCWGWFSGRWRSGGAPSYHAQPDFRRGGHGFQFGVRGQQQPALFFQGPGMQLYWPWAMPAGHQASGKWWLTSKDREVPYV